MRRDVELWIGTRRADLADDGFILMNYTMEDLASPAVVRNSFSRQITLPGTTANNQIFGEIFRNDRQTQYHATNETGVYFDPTRKTTWRIYNGRSEILDSGYLRLDSVTRKRNVVVEYKVTLYGGLGSFLYGLTYNAAGEKRTLADLNYRGTSSPVIEFDFFLTATSIRAAWARIAGASGDPSNVWDFINFAPCYNGLPGGPFDASKGVLDVVACGIANDSYGTTGGLALVELAQKYTEWQAKDLRSYLQRPVVRMRSVIEAVCASRNNGGWTVNLDPDFFDAGNPYWQKTWMTLPLIDTEALVTSDSGTGTLTFSAVGSAAHQRATLSPGGDNTKNYGLTVKLAPKAELASAMNGSLFMHCESGGTVWMNYVEYLIRACDNNGNVVDERYVRISSRTSQAAQTDVPPIDSVGWFSFANSGIGSWSEGQLSVSLSGRGVKTVEIYVSAHAVKWGTASADTPSALAMWSNSLDYSSLVNASGYTANYDGGSYSYSGYGGGRSGRLVTKADLLSGGGTPADYLVGFCKTFGLVMVADHATKTVSIEKRGTFYDDEVVDISDRIDMDEGYDKSPFSFDAKWYVWATQIDSGEWAKSYAQKYGRTFGQMQLGTGYAFDANTNQVMTGVVFRGAVMALESSKYYCSVVEDGKELPSVLLDHGAKYMRAGEPVDVWKPSAAAVVTWMNPEDQSYDLFPKPQFHDADDAPVDGRDVMLFFSGMHEFSSSSNIGDYVDVPLAWQDMTHPQSNRASKYIDVPVKAGDVITIKLSDYTTWRVAGVVTTRKGWGQGSTISDSGWKSADYTKVVSSSENGYYFRISIARQDNGDFILSDALAALTEAVAIRRVEVTLDGSPYTVTDDTDVMLTLNSGTPCWLLRWAAVDSTKVVSSIPRFSRYLDYSSLHAGYVYEKSMDFGTPAEVPIPGVSFRPGSTIWEQFFADYYADRYDDDSAVVRCKVNLAGMQVGPDLMRRFYWFDGAVWALNKITNHSMTTWDLTECEFIKVQDVDNYTT